MRFLVFWSPIKISVSGVKHDRWNRGQIVTYPMIRPPGPMIGKVIGVPSLHSGGGGQVGCGVGVRTGVGVGVAGVGVGVAGVGVAVGVAVDVGVAVAVEVGV